MTRYVVLLPLLFSYAFCTITTSNTDLSEFEKYLSVEMFPELEPFLFPKELVPVKQEPVDSLLKSCNGSDEEVIVKIELFEDNEGMIPIETDPMIVVKHEPTDVEVQGNLEPRKNPIDQEIFETEPVMITNDAASPPMILPPADGSVASNYSRTIDCIGSNLLSTSPHQTMPPVEKPKKQPAVHFSLSKIKQKPIPRSSLAFLSSSLSSSSSSDSSVSSSSESEKRKRPSEGRGRSPSPKRYRTRSSPSPNRHRTQRNRSPQSRRSRNSSSEYSRYSQSIRSSSVRQRRNPSSKRRPNDRPSNIDRYPRDVSPRRPHDKPRYKVLEISKTQLDYQFDEMSDSRIAIYFLRHITGPDVIYDRCTSFGPVKDMVYLRDSGSTKNVAFVEFKYIKDAENALESFDCTTTSGQLIAASFCRQEFSLYTRVVRALVPHEKPLPLTLIESIFNISYMESRYGTTLSAYYCPNLKAGFVIFANEDSAIRALEGLGQKGFITSRRCDHNH